MTRKLGLKTWRVLWPNEKKKNQKKKSRNGPEIVFAAASPSSILPINKASHSSLLPSSIGVYLSILSMDSEDAALPGFDEDDFVAPVAVKQVRREDIGLKKDEPLVCYN